MRFMKIAAAVAMALACGSAYAFHDGGVAACEGCHVMHNASGGASKSYLPNHYNDAANGAYLLQGADQSSTCLICHADRTLAGDATVLTRSLGPTGVPTNYTPGGDF